MMISLLIVIEILIFTFGLFLTIRKHNSISGSLAYSSVLSLAVLSMLIQVFFLMGIPQLFFLCEIFLVIFSIFQIIKNCDVIKHDFKSAFGFLKQNKPVMYLFFPVLAYLFIQTFLVPPNNTDSMIYNLSRVLMFNRQGSAFIENYSVIHQAAFPIGFDLLPFLFLRFNTDFALGIFSFMSYITIIAATFSLVGNFFNKRLGLFTTLIIASLTELILQATTTKNDIPCAAVVTVIFLAGYHFFNRLKPMDFYMIVVCLLWGVTVKAYFPGFALPFVLFYSLFLMKKLSFKGFFKLFTLNNLMSRKSDSADSASINFGQPFMRMSTRIVPVFLPLGLIFCMVFFYGSNLSRFGTLWGNEKSTLEHQNKDGITGGILNAARYVIQSAEIPVKYGYKINGLHDSLLKENKWKGTRNRNESIDLARKPFISEDYSWYGPLGFFLIIPCVLFSLFFTKGYVRVIAASLVFYFLIVSYQVVWMEWNTRFFSLFFAGSGLCVALVLGRIFDRKNSVSRVFKGALAFIAVGCLISAAVQNDGKLTVPKYKSVYLGYNLFRLGEKLVEGRFPTQKCFTWIRNLSDRRASYKDFYPPNMLDTYISKVEPHKNVLILGSFSPVFPLLFTRPDLNITVSRFTSVSVDNKIYSLDKYDDYMLMKEKFDYIVILTFNLKKFQLNKYLENEVPMFTSLDGWIFLLKKDFLLPK